MLPTTPSLSWELSPTSPWLLRSLLSPVCETPATSKWVLYFIDMFFDNQFQRLRTPPSIHWIARSNLYMYASWYIPLIFVYLSLIRDFRYSWGYLQPHHSLMESKPWRCGFNRAPRFLVHYGNDSLVSFRLIRKSSMPHIRVYLALLSPGVLFEKFR